MCFGFLTNVSTQLTVHACDMITHLKLRKQWQGAQNLLGGGGEWSVRQLLSKLLIPS